ncbi:hypothetical protein J7T55_011717 [Diaporthe amygdali]|uniref:uncharacterized protein n=1 Tax=Phomopsis amygdali TaxID=1214568 RepID=UPI0022FDC95A|nr:uncharacterized protein J7T55_011717 [Diaporthe amygdali]KAJ0123253.1 hypothetical protein J7T55_011717 [Diaporthe amygdali]
MTTYAKNIFPMCQGVAKCATEQKTAFDKYYLKTGQVKYFDKADEGKLDKAQRLDDLYGALTSLSEQLPTSMSEKDKKALIQKGLNEYYRKKDAAAAYLHLGMNRSEKPKSPKDAVAWFDETQKTLNGLIHNLQQVLNGWNP